MYQVVSSLSRQPSISEASEVAESVSDAVSEGPDPVKSSASNATSKGPMGGAVISIALSPDNVAGRVLHEKGIIAGILERSSPACVRVSELPVGMWVEDFKSSLEALVGETPEMKSYTNECTKSAVGFTIVFTSRAAADAWTSSSLGGKLDLMSASDPSLKERTDDTDDTDMTDVIEGTERVEGVEGLLRSHGFEMVEGSFRYLLSMPMSSVTRNRKAALERERNAKSETLRAMESTTAAEMYLADLDRLEAYLKTYY
eukprot:gene28829-32018_t